MAKYEITKSDDILTVSFSVALKGYSPKEVDVTLDSIYDYTLSLHHNINELKILVKEKQNQLQIALEKQRESDIQLAALKNKLETELVDCDSTKNIDYLNRIRKLEMCLHKMGVDPTTIK